MHDQEYMVLFLQEVAKKLFKDQKVEYKLLDKKVRIKTEYLIELAKEQPRFNFNVVEDFVHTIEIEDIERNEKGILTFVCYG